MTQATDAAEIAQLRENSPGRMSYVDSGFRMLCILTNSFMDLFVPDFKESIEIGREDDATWKNEWPSESDLPGFKKVIYVSIPETSWSFEN